MKILLMTPTSAIVSSSDQPPRPFETVRRWKVIPPELRSICARGVRLPAQLALNHDVVGRSDARELPSLALDAQA